jgi:xanthine dehydrogenase YagR molybdenum-binding subunit
VSAIGAPLQRIEGPAKVTGAARYAYEQLGEDEALYAWIVQAPTAKGRVRRINTAELGAMPGVVLVLTHENAPKLEGTDDAQDGELQLLQDDRIAYRGQVVAVVVAETLEQAREAATAAVVEVEAEPFDVVLTPDSPKMYRPEKVNPTFPAETSSGDVDAALADAPVVVDVTYVTPAYFNSPMEPHATIARQDGDDLHLDESTQGSSATKQTLSALFGMDPERIHVENEHVGGGFGSKGSPRPNAPLAILAARLTGRPVKLAYTRQQMFALAGYRTPTFSRMRLAADRDGHLTAISHEAFSQTSTIEEFAEQTAEGTRHLYASPNLFTTHRLAALDVQTPRWMRAPGEAPGIFALESAMDELAVALDLDPIELRKRNEPEVDPEDGSAWSSRNLVWCFDRGAELFGWQPRGAAPTMRRDGRFLVGTGVASATYPAMAQRSAARVVARADGDFDLGVNAADIGTGARTVLRQIAADALEVPPERIRIRIGDSDLPQASVAGGSSGTASWGWAVHDACTDLLGRLREGVPIPPEGLAVVGDIGDVVQSRPVYSRHAFGAHFVEVRIDLDSGEVLVPRMVGVFAAGRIMNPRTARSQFIGGMTMGLGMALHEVGELDVPFGDIANHDFATYHVPVSADVQSLEVDWLDEMDDHLTPMGGKGIGEIGIVGAAAAVLNAVRDATGVRLRELPLQPDTLVPHLPPRFG